MKFEFTHDFIAKQVYEKSSAEAKARRKVEAIVQRALQRHQDNSRILLSAEDLAEIKIFEAMINFSEQEQAFIRKSQRVINQKRNLLIGAVSAAFIILSILVIWALNEQRKAKNEQQHSLATALAAKSYELQMKGDNTTALRFAQYAYQTTDRDASRQALFHSYFQRNKYYYHKSIKADSNAIVGAAFSAQDTPVLMTTSLNGNIKFWNEELEQFKTLVHNHASAKIAISPDGDLIAIARSDSSLQIRPRASQSEGLFIKHPSVIDQIYFSPADSIVMTITRNENAWLWKFDGQPYDTLSNIGRVKSATFSPDGQYILTAGTSDIKIWSKHGQFLDNLRLINPEKIQFFPASLTKAPNCYLFGSIYAGTKLKFWSLCIESGKVKLKEVATLPEQQKLLINMDIAPNGKMALTVNYDYVDLFQLQISSSNAVDLVSLGQLKGHIGFINQAIFSPFGERLYTVSDDQTIKLWQLSTFSRPFETIMDKSLTGDQSIYKILEDPAYVLSKAVQSGSDEEMANYKVWRFFDFVQPKVIMELKGQQVQVVPNSDGSMLATYSYDESVRHPIIQLWDSLGNKLAASKTKLEDFISLGFLAGDQQFITFQKNNRFKIWNLKGEIITSLQVPGNFSSIAPSPVDSNLIALLTDRIEGKSIISLYNLATDSLRNFYSTSELDEGGIVKFSHSGKHILSVHFDKIEIWSSDGELLKSIISYDESFIDAFFAKEDNYLIAIDAYQALVMDWTKVENQVATIGNVEQAIFSKNMEHILIINHQTNELERWPFAPAKIITKIEQMKIADLDTAEKERHGIER